MDKNIVTEDEYVDKKLKPWKSGCCKSTYYRKGRADLRCKVCDKDVTMEIVLLTDMFIRDYKLKYNKNGISIKKK